MKKLTGIPLAFLLLVGLGAGSPVDATLNLGDTFFGEICNQFDSDVLRFDALAGSFASIEAKADGNEQLLPRIQVTDLTTNIVLAFEASGEKKTKIENLPMPSTGTYEVRITGLNGTAGEYRVKTKRKLEGHLLGFASEDQVPGGGTLSFAFDALPGFELKEGVLKARNPAAVDNVNLEAPSGLPISLTGFVSGSTEELKLAHVPLPELGTYTLSVQNVGGTGTINTKVRLEKDDPDHQVLVEQDDCP